MVLTLWTCPQNCDYLCQRTVTANRIGRGESIEQFHGKWPFQRVFGIQEPMSVLFSILNFIPHYYGIKKLRRFLKPSLTTPRVLVYTYIGIAITGMNAWTWSSVFHVRDFVLTERLDYFSAGLTVLYGFYACTVRAFGLYRTRSSLQGVRNVDAVATRNRLVRQLLSVACIVAYLSHVYYLQFVKFDYGYNMLANVVIGLIQNVLWVRLAISSYNKSASAATGGRKQSWKLMPLYLVIAVTLAMSFELFDFPPILDALDAHSLWHAGTVLPTYFWYVWLEHDLNSMTLTKIKI